LDVTKGRVRDLDYKRISKENHFKIVSIQKEEKKGLDAYKKKEDTSAKKRETLSDLSKKYEVSRDTNKRLLRQELGIKKNRELFPESNKPSELIKKQNNELIREYTSQDIKDQL